MHEYRYLITFNLNGQIGNVPMGFDAPIGDMTDVAKVQQSLREHFGVPDVMVVAFSRFANRDAEATR